MKNDPESIELDRNIKELQTENNALENEMKFFESESQKVKKKIKAINVIKKIKFRIK